MRLIMLALTLLALLVTPALADTAEIDADQTTVGEAQVAAAEDGGAAEACGVSTGEDLFVAFPQELEGMVNAGASCGGAVCGKFEYCCNPTCSRCVPFGWSCTQEVCN